MENEVDTEALNAALNTPTNANDSYGEEPETEEPEQTTEPETEEETEPEVKAEDLEEEEEDPDPRPLTRGQARIQALANEKAALAQEKLLAEQRAQLLERQLQQMQQRPLEDENLTDLEKWQRQADMTIRQVQMQNLDMQDRSDFLMQISKNPAEAAYIERVEQTLADARKQGFNPKREDVLIRLMGIDARSKLKQAPAVKRDAAQRVAAAKGKPLVSKSNVAQTKTESTEYDRLKGINI